MPTIFFCSLLENKCPKEQLKVTTSAYMKVLWNVLSYLKKKLNIQEESQGQISVVYWKLKFTEVKLIVHVSINSPIINQSINLSIIFLL